MLPSQRPLIHQFWHDDNPPYPALTEFLRWDYDYVLWTPASIPDELSQLLDDVRDRVSESSLLRHTANVVRLWVLQRFGGVWLDHDVFPVEPLHTRYPYAAAHGTLCNCVLAFPAEHPMLQLALERIIAAPESSSYRSTEVSGETMLHEVLTKDVRLRQLPFDAAGQPIPGGTTWAVHLYSTSGRLAKCP